MCLYVKYGASAVLFGCDYSSSFVEHSHILIHLIYFLTTSAKSLLTVYPSEVQQQCNRIQCLVLDLVKKKDKSQYQRQIPHSFLFS